MILLFEHEEYRTDLLEVSLTVGCPFKCKYCPQDVIEKSYCGEKIMSRDILQCSLENCESVFVFGGFSDPWLHPKCSEFIEKAKQYPLEIRVYHTLDLMKESDFDCLDGVHNKVHLPYGDDMSIEINDEYLYKIELIKKYDTVFCCSKPDVHPKLKKAIKGCRFEQFYASNRAGNAFHDDWKLPNIRIKAENPLRKNDLLEFIRIEEEYLTTNFKKGEIICATSQHPVILPDGDTVLCTHDWGIRHPLGNIRNGIKNITKEFRKLKNQWNADGKETLCRTCHCSAVCYKRLQ